MTEADPLPIACALDHGTLQDRRREWETLIKAHLIGVVAISGGVSLRLQQSGRTLSEISRLVALEKECCPWITWSVLDEGTEGIALELTSANRMGAEVLREWFGIRA